MGKIPPLLSNMRSLQVLDLTSNALQGHIPESLGGMTELRELWLGCVQKTCPTPFTILALLAPAPSFVAGTQTRGHTTVLIVGSSPRSLTTVRIAQCQFAGRFQHFLPSSSRFELRPSAAGVVSRGSTTKKCSTLDLMLHRDSCEWERGRTIQAHRPRRTRS